MYGVRLGAAAEQANGMRRRRFARCREYAARRRGLTVLRVETGNGALELRRGVCRYGDRVAAPRAAQIDGDARAVRVRLARDARRGDRRAPVGGEAHDAVRAVVGLPRSADALDGARGHRIRPPAP